MRQFEPGQDRKVAALRAPSYVMSHLQLFFARNFSLAIIFFIYIISFLNYEELTMSTPISTGYSLQAYGIHAFGGLFAAVCVRVLAKKTQKYFFPNANRNLSKYIAPGMGFAAGIATTMWIASSPLAQKLATGALMGAIAGPQITNAIDEVPRQLFLDIVGPQFRSLSSLLCGVAGTVLGCWAFHKLS